MPDPAAEEAEADEVEAVQLVQLLQAARLQPQLLQAKTNPKPLI